MYLCIVFRRTKCHFSGREVALYEAKNGMLIIHPKKPKIMANGILKYKKYQKKDNNNPNSEPLWYARAVQDRTVDFDGLVTHMSEHNSPYSRGVIHGVLTDMLDCVKELVLDGKNVRLGDLGLFSINLKTKGAVAAEDWKVASHLKGVRLNVRNTKMWSNTELRNSCTLQELSKYSGGEETPAEEGEADDAAA